MFFLSGWFRQVLLYYINSFPASSDLCCLLITFANTFGPDQYQLTVASDLDQRLFDTLIVFRKISFENVNFDKSYKLTTKV